MSRKVDSPKQALNLNIDKGIKKEFKIDVAKMDVNMSMVTEALISYWLSLTDDKKRKFLESK